MLLSTTSIVASSNGIAAMSPVCSSTRSATRSRSALRRVASALLPDWSLPFQRSMPIALPDGSSCAALSKDGTATAAHVQDALVSAQTEVLQQSRPDDELSPPGRMDVAAAAGDEEHGSDDRDECPEPRSGDRGDHRHHEAEIATAQQEQGPHWRVYAVVTTGSRQVRHVGRS